MPGSAKRPRLRALDLLRGYFLLVILIDHTRFFPSLFELVTGRGEMWASAAEGFFMISGLLVGYIYGPRMARSLWDTARRLWQRAFLLYALSALLTFLFVWWGNHSDIAHIKEGLWIQPETGELLSKVLTLQYYYGWADFLPYYAIFMAWAPLVLYAIVRGKAWAVLAVSAFCWAMRGQSFEMSWQVLFMGSMVAGWYLPQLESWFRSLRPELRRHMRLGLYASAGLLVVASVLTIRVGEMLVHEYAGFASLPPLVQQVGLWLDGARGYMTPLIVKWTLEPVRLVTAVVWFAALYVWVRRYEHTIDTWSRGALRFLGERSLVVYVLHSMVVFALLLALGGNYGFWINTLMTAVVAVVLYGLAWMYAVMMRRSRRTLYQSRQLQFTREEST